MKIKRGTSIAGLQLPMRQALIYAERLWRKHGEELVITCGLNGVHSAGSLHYYGYALDFRVRYFAPNIRLTIAQELRRLLGAEFDVILESNHIHVEYQKALESF